MPPPSGSLLFLVRRSTFVARSWIGAGDVHVAGAERALLAGLQVVRVAPGAAGVVRQQVDRDGRLGRRRSHAVDVVRRRKQRVEVTWSERAALGDLEPAVAGGVDLLVLGSSVQPDETPR